RASRDSLIQRVRFITEKVNESDAKLKASEQRIRELSTLSDSLRTTLGETVTNYQTVISSQKETIDQLTEQINQFSADKVALVDSVNQLQEKLNTVYYVIGTKDELLKNGIIVKEGGSRCRRRHDDGARRRVGAGDGGLVVNRHREPARRERHGVV